MIEEPPALDFLVADPLGGQKPAVLIALLHGLGADKTDLMSLAEPLQMFIQVPTKVVSPDAPFPCDLSPFGRQWFSMADAAPEKLVEGVRTAAPALRKFLMERAAEAELSIQQTILIGFSQGAMMALHIALRLEAEALGVVCCSGGLIEDHRLSSELYSRPPTLICHGKEDPVVPLSVAEETVKLLEPIKMPLEVHHFDRLAHTIDERVLAKVGAFLHNVTAKISHHKKK